MCGAEGTRLQALRNGAALLDLCRALCNTLFYGMARHYKGTTARRAAAKDASMPGGVSGAAVGPVCAARNVGARPNCPCRDCRSARGRFGIGAFACTGVCLPLPYDDGDEARGLRLLPSARRWRKGTGGLPGAVRHGSARYPCRRRVLACCGSPVRSKDADDICRAVLYACRQPIPSQPFACPAHSSTLSSVTGFPRASARCLTLSQKDTL